MTLKRDILIVSPEEAHQELTRQDKADAPVSFEQEVKEQCEIVCTGGYVHIQNERMYLALLEEYEASGTTLLKLHFQRPAGRMLLWCERIKGFTMLFNQAATTSSG